MSGRIRASSAALPEHVPEFLRNAYTLSGSSIVHQDTLNLFDELQNEEDRQLQRAQHDPTGQHPYSWSVARERDNREKNRYSDILPYNNSRVRLTPVRCPFSGAVVHGDYINASRVSPPGGIRSYITTQGPLPKTVVDFWRMIWQEKSRVVVMLTNIYERGKVKCHPYWPEQVGDTLRFDSAGLEVRFISEETAINGEVVVRRMEVIRRAPVISVAESERACARASGEGSDRMRRTRSTGGGSIGSISSLSNTGPRDASSTLLKDLRATPVRLGMPPLRAAALAGRNQHLAAEVQQAKQAATDGTEVNIAPGSSLPDGMGSSRANGQTVVGSAPKAPPANFTLAKPPLARKVKGKKEAVMATTLGVSDVPATPSPPAPSHAGSSPGPLLSEPKAVSDGTLNMNAPTRFTVHTLHSGNEEPGRQSILTGADTPMAGSARRSDWAPTVAREAANERPGGRNAKRDSSLPVQARSSAGPSGMSSMKAGIARADTTGGGGKQSSGRGHVLRGISDWFHWLTRNNGAKQEPRSEQCAEGSGDGSLGGEKGVSGAAWHTDEICSDMQPPPRKQSRLDTVTSTPPPLVPTLALPRPAVGQSSRQSAAPAASDVKGSSSLRIVTNAAMPVKTPDAPAAAPMPATALNDTYAHAPPPPQQPSALQNRAQSTSANAANARHRMSAPPSSVLAMANELSEARTEIDLPPASASVHDSEGIQHLLSPIVVPDQDPTAALMATAALSGHSADLMSTLLGSTTYADSNNIGDDYDGDMIEQRAIITQIHFTTWPDHGVPDQPDNILRLIQLVDKTQKSSGTNGPVVVHCSAGCGRTGTFCVIDSAVAILTATRDGSIDMVDKLTRHFRTQRCTMVQTSQQFWFCYVAVLRRLLTVLQRSRSNTL